MTMEHPEPTEPQQPAEAEQPQPAEAEQPQPVEPQPEQPQAEQPPAEPQPPQAEASGKPPQPPPHPMIVVEFLGPDSAVFNCRFINMRDDVAIYQMSVFSKWLEERCSFFFQYGFERQFAEGLVKRQMDQEAAKGAPKRPDLLVPPPGMRMPPRRPK